jgi:hypothetical protein
MIDASRKEARPKPERSRFREACISRVHFCVGLRLGISHLDAIYEHRLCTATTEALDRYSERAQTADSLAEIFDDLVTVDALAAALREEGHRKGHVEGYVAASITALSRLLVFKFKLSWLDAIYERRLRRATPEELDKYFQRALEADSFTDVFEDMIGHRTIADALREEGRWKGCEEGRLQASIVAVRQLVMFRFKLQQLDAHHEHRLWSATLEDVEQYFWRALEATSPAAVFKD